MRFLILALILLTGLTACGGNMFKRNVEEPPFRYGFADCDMELLEGQKSYYTREYNRLWSSLTRKMFAESVEVPEAMASEARGKQQQLKSLEYRINAGYRSALNSCKALDDCIEVNGLPESSDATGNVCASAADRRNREMSSFMGYEKELRSVSNDISDYERKLSVPSFTTDPEEEGTDGDDADLLKRKEDCKPVGTVFMECD